MIKPSNVVLVMFALCIANQNSFGQSNSEPPKLILPSQKKESKESPDPPPPNPFEKEVDPAPDPSEPEFPAPDVISNPRSQGGTFRFKFDDVDTNGFIRIWANAEPDHRCQIYALPFLNQTPESDKKNSQLLNELKSNSVGENPRFVLDEGFGSATIIVRGKSFGEVLPEGVHRVLAQRRDVQGNHVVATVEYIYIGIPERENAKQLPMLHETWTDPTKPLFAPHFQRIHDLHVELLGKRQLGAWGDKWIQRWSPEHGGTWENQHEKLQMPLLSPLIAEAENALVPVGIKFEDDKSTAAYLANDSNHRYPFWIFDQSSQNLYQPFNRRLAEKLKTFEQLLDASTIQKHPDFFLALSDQKLGGLDPLKIDTSENDKISGLLRGNSGLKVVSDSRANSNVALVNATYMFPDDLKRAMSFNGFDEGVIHETLGNNQEYLKVLLNEEQTSKFLSSQENSSMTHYPFWVLRNRDSTEQFSHSTLFAYPSVRTTLAQFVENLVKQNSLPLIKELLKISKDLGSAGFTPLIIPNGGNEFSLFVHIPTRHLLVLESENGALTTKRFRVTEALILALFDDLDHISLHAVVNDNPANSRFLVGIGDPVRSEFINENKKVPMWLLSPESQKDLLILAEEQDLGADDDFSELFNSISQPESLSQMPGVINAMTPALANGPFSFARITESKVEPGSDAVAETDEVFYLSQQQNQTNPSGRLFRFNATDATDVKSIAWSASRTLLSYLKSGKTIDSTYREAGINSKPTLVAAGELDPIASENVPIWIASNQGTFSPFVAESTFTDDLSYSKSRISEFIENEWNPSFWMRNRDLLQRLHDYCILNSEIRLWPMSNDKRKEVVVFCFEKDGKLNALRVDADSTFSTVLPGALIERLRELPKIERLVEVAVSKISSNQGLLWLNPDLLQTGQGTGDSNVTVSESIATFESNETYPIWLSARNGNSTPIFKFHKYPDSPLYDSESTEVPDELTSKILSNKMLVEFIKTRAADATSTPTFTLIHNSANKFGILGNQNERKLTVVLDESGKQLFAQVETGGKRRSRVVSLAEQVNIPVLLSSFETGAWKSLDKMLPAFWTEIVLAIENEDRMIWFAGLPSTESVDGNNGKFGFVFGPEANTPDLMDSSWIIGFIRQPSGRNREQFDIRMGTTQEIFSKISNRAPSVPDDIKEEIKKCENVAAKCDLMSTIASDVIRFHLSPVRTLDLEPIHAKWTKGTRTFDPSQLFPGRANASGD